MTDTHKPQTDWNTQIEMLLARVFVKGQLDGIISDEIQELRTLLHQRDEELVAELEGMRVRNKLYDEALARENIERFGYEHINTQEYGLNKAIDKAIALVREGK